MDFASLSVLGAAPAADPSALLGAPSTSPTAGEAFADLFAQAMVAVPPGLDAGPAAPVTDAASASLPASTIVPVISGTVFSTGTGSDTPVLPHVSGTSSSGTFSAGAPDMSISEASAPKDLEPRISAPFDELPLEGTPASSPTDQGTRPLGAEKTGRKNGVPTLPDCPTVPLLPDGPIAPPLPPDRPPVSSETALPIQGDRAEGGEAENAFDDEESLGQGDASPSPTTTPLLAPGAAAGVVSAATVSTRPLEVKSPTKIAAVGSAAKLSDVSPLSDEVSPQAPLPVALDLGIVPQVTVTASNTDAPISATPVLERAPTALSPQPAATPPPTAPSSLAAAPKDENGAGAKVESVKGRETPSAPNALKTASGEITTKGEAKAESKANLGEPVLEIAVQERKDDGEAPSGESPKDANPESVVPQPTESGVRETAATARPELGSDRPAVDRHLVVRQVADRIENMVAARPRDGVTIHMEPHELGTVTLVVKGLASALDVQVTASDERVRQSLDASRPELAQALAPRGIGLREIRVEHVPSTTSPSSSTTADSGSGSSQNRSGSGSSQPQPRQSPAAFRTSAPATPRPRASRTNGRGVDLLV